MSVKILEEEDLFNGRDAGAARLHDQHRRLICPPLLNHIYN